MPVFTLLSTVAGKCHPARSAAVPGGARRHAGDLSPRQRGKPAAADAVDNMSQGLCTFDAQGRIVLVNRRYIDMYKLSPRVVKSGCTLHDLIQHRKDTGLFSGDVAAYCQNILRRHGQGPEHARVCAGERRPHRTGQERADAGRRLGLHRTRTSPNSATPKKNAPRSRNRSSAAPISMRRSHRSGRRWRSCWPASATAPPPCARPRRRCLAPPSRPRSAPKARCRPSKKLRPMSRPRRSPPTNCRARSPRSAAS